MYLYTLILRLRLRIMVGKHWLASKPTFPSNLFLVVTRAVARPPLRPSDPETELELTPETEPETELELTPETEPELEPIVEFFDPTSDPVEEGKGLRIALRISV